MTMPTTEQTFRTFLNNFVPNISCLEKDCQLATWELYTKASPETEARVAQTSATYTKAYADKTLYAELVAFDTSGKITDPLLARQLKLLVLAFQGNMLPDDLIEEMANKSASLEATFGGFRPTLNGQQATDNEICNILKKEKEISLRKQAWEASKQVGVAMAPLVRDLVRLRNRAANILGYSNYFAMAYALSELDPIYVLQTFDALIQESTEARNIMFRKINNQLSQRFSIPLSKIGPWAWSEPFGQEDPIANPHTDDIFASQDLVAKTVAFYDSLGLDLRAIYARSDLYERLGKNPHAYCFHIDRSGDIRMLMNVLPNHYWFSRAIHESGHGLYEQHFSYDLPWLLRAPSHLLTTEGYAMMMEKYAANTAILQLLFQTPAEQHTVLNDIQESAGRQRLIFAGWANVMVRFEKYLYEQSDAHPTELQNQWWFLVEKYQHIRRPAGRDHLADWASKVHIATAPCYYQNYLLGDVFSAQVNAALRRYVGTDNIFGKKEAGKFLKERLFAPGASLHWQDLTRHVTGRMLSIDDWVKSIS